MSTTQRGIISSMVESTTYSLPITSWVTNSKFLQQHGSFIHWKWRKCNGGWYGIFTTRYNFHGGNVLDAIYLDKLRDDSHIIDTFFKSLKCAPTTPLFDNGRSKSTQLGTTRLLYNLKEMYGTSDSFFLVILR